jgi:glycosyltransferase involved in cell wall biosynthesis
MSPQVSILINNYNYGRFLADAIESALNQSYPHCEVIVVDDGSTDHSAAVIKGYGGARYCDRIIPIFKPNGGQASAFNAGFAASRGEIICFLDADDVFAPTKAAEVAAVFSQNSDIQWCFHPLTLMDEALEKTLLQPTLFEARHCDVRQAVRTGSLKGKLPALIPATSGLCFRRSLLQQLLPMPESITITSDDYLKFTAVGIAPGFFSDLPLASQRIHGSNAYTHNPQQQPVKATISIATAYWMTTHFPELSQFADNLLSIGLGITWQTGGAEPQSHDLITRYFTALPLSRKLKINAKALYHYMRYTLAA